MIHDRRISVVFVNSLCSSTLGCVSIVRREKTLPIIREQYAVVKRVKERNCLRFCTRKTIGNGRNIPDPTIILLHFSCLKLVKHMLRCRFVVIFHHTEICIEFE